MDTVVQVAVSLVVAVVTSFLTVELSLKRFYREKRWEAKMAAYTAIIGSLHQMKRHLQVSIDAEMSSSKVVSPLREELEQKYWTAHADILKNTDIGEFLLSDGAAKELRAFRSAFSAPGKPNESYYEHLDSGLTAVVACLANIKALAREDLGG